MYTTKIKDMTFVNNIICLIFLLISTILYSQDSDELNISLYESSIVNTEKGLLQGIYDNSTGLKIFLGVPYAKPPIDELRWKEPQPLDSWEGIKQVFDFGPRPIQKIDMFDMRFRSDLDSEDSLYLNIWTPASDPNEQLPVLVYFYGGGFIGGDGSEWRYDGSNMAQRGIVVVTVNYRLGVFGFFAHPELTKESPNKTSGNYGLLDQNAALEWVYNNIRSFGGNPDRITIGGESAGSFSVSAHMASPLSKNLIHGAIGESGSIIGSTLPVVNLQEAEDRGVRFAKKIDFPSISELRRLSAEELQEYALKEDISYFTRTVDGYFFEEQPERTFEEGRQAKVPLLAGWNSTEMPYTYFMQNETPTSSGYIKKVEEQFGENASLVLDVYPGKTQEEVISSSTHLGSNLFIVYGTWKWMELHQKNGYDVYRYVFHKSRPGGFNFEMDDGLKDLPKPIPGAGHSWEIEYALGNLDKTNKFYDWTPDDYKVSAIMFNYFANFIKMGDPNSENLNGLPQWSRSADANNNGTMNIDVNSYFEKEVNRDQLEVLDKIKNIK